MYSVCCYLLAAPAPPLLSQNQQGRSEQPSWLAHQNCWIKGEIGRLQSPTSVTLSPVLLVPSVLSVCIRLPEGFGSRWLRLSQASHAVWGWARLSPAPCCIHYSQHCAPLLILPYPCYTHVLNTLQMLLDVFLTHFLWSPRNLLCRNNCNLFKCQQATRGRQQLCARAEQLQGKGPILPLERRSKLEERKRPLTSIS